MDAVDDAPVPPSARPILTDDTGTTGGTGTTATATATARVTTSVTTSVNPLPSPARAREMPAKFSLIGLRGSEPTSRTGGRTVPGLPSSPSAPPRPGCISPILPGQRKRYPFLSGPGLVNSKLGTAGIGKETLSAPPPVPSARGYHDDDDDVDDDDDGDADAGEEAA